MDENTDGLTKETETPENQPTPETTPPASESVITPEKEPDTPPSDDVSDLLADGTPKDKDVRIPYKKFEEMNERTKILEQLSPLIVRIQKEPELVERLMKGEDRNSIEARLAAIEEERRTQKRQVMESTLKVAVRTWSDFREKWNQIQPLVVALEHQGIEYPEAVERSYFAINPEAAKEEARLTAQIIANRYGVVTAPSGTSARPPLPQEKKQLVYTMSEDDTTFARSAGIKPELYEKHADWIKQKGLDQL